MNLASRIGRCTPCENDSRTHRIVGWMLEKKGIEPRFPDRSARGQLIYQICSKKLKLRQNGIDYHFTK
jgi:hypothetical protein